MARRLSCDVITDEGQFHRSFGQKIDYGETLRECARVTGDLPTVGAYGSHRGAAPIVTIKVEGQSGQCRSGDGVGAGNRSVHAFPVSKNEGFMLLRGREKSTLFLIHKVTDQVLRESRGCVEIRFSGTGFIEIQQSLCQVGIVFKIGVEMGTITS